MLETVSATGHVIPPFIVWKNKVHCDGFYATGDSRPAIFSQSPSGYMDDELDLDYMVKHFELHTRPADLDGAQAP